MSNSKYENDSFEDDLIEEFGLKDDEDETISDLDSELRPKIERLGMQAPEEEYIFDKKAQEKKENKKNNKKIKSTNKILLIGIICIILFILIDAVLISYKILHKEQINYKPLLLYTSKPVVYDNSTIIKQPNDQVPTINIKNQEIDQINNEIIKIYHNYYNNNPFYFRYEFSINNDNLSLLIIYKNKLPDEKNYSYKFKTYNISFKTITNISDKEILKRYNLKLSDVHKKMRNNFYKNYEELLKKNYINESYSYNSLITDLELTNFTKETNYYIDNNKLYVYRSYNIYGNNKINSYFTESKYKFYIK